MPWPSESHSSPSRRSLHWKKSCHDTSIYTQSQSSLPYQVIPPWRLRDSVDIRLSNVPKEANTFVLWQSFSKEGSISSIDLFEDFHGNGDHNHKGKLRFRFITLPPPATDFWRHGKYSIILLDGRSAIISVTLVVRRPDLRTPSPVRPEICYPAELVSRVYYYWYILVLQHLQIAAIDIGVLVDETTFLPMRTAGAGSNERAFMIASPRSKCVQIYFQLPILNSRRKSTNPSDSLYHYYLKIPFSQLARIFQSRDSESGRVSQSTLLDSPPFYYRRVNNIASTFTDDKSWKDTDTWFRQTQIVHDPLELTCLPLSLRKLNPVIDIGRWNVLRITYPENSDLSDKFMMLCDILKDHNVAIDETKSFTEWAKGEERPPAVWKWIDISENKASKGSSSLEELVDDAYVHLPFSVRYQLEVCLSNGYLSEFTMTRDFAAKLADLGEVKARRLLEHVAAKKQIYYDPMKILGIICTKGVTDTKIPPYCCYMRSARVTPGTIYYDTPVVDISNRVVRQYIEYVDRFLRVSFTDEKSYGKINSIARSTEDEIFTRIKRALANGIVIGSRRYEFLAFGNSQLREHGAYFFAPLPSLTASNIRAWMGDFGDIRNIAKYAARLGQCFSTTRAIASCPVRVRNIPDISRNGYMFSDGVGRISKFLAQMVMSDLGIKTPTGEPPSAFQFRLGGCKGMLIVDSRAQRHEAHIRGSQHKFPAKHNGLEIIRWSQSSAAVLNRQIIIVLSSLGINDKVFHDKLKIMLKGLDEAMVDDNQAIYLLEKYIDSNQMTLSVRQMVLDGFRRTKEPFMRSVLALWRAWHLKYLKEKARIVINQGVCVLGCMDETGILKGHFSDPKLEEHASYEERLAVLPEIFLQVAPQDDKGKYEVIEGVCILSRNPALHPGDVRIVKAVSVPQLSHLQNVVVFPQTGDRDIPSMCSGGDLDGDDYLVIWDAELIPKYWFTAPMEYVSSKARDLDHDVTVDEITSFFVTYIKNDCLPRIAHAHLAWADRLDGGVTEAKCLKLAQLHSDAVDYNKTGNPAVMVRSLAPHMWPHFMEKKDPLGTRTYKSQKILGQLYDAIERIDFAPSLKMPFDKRILDCPFKAGTDLTEFARDLKSEYDVSIRRIMARHEIKTEFEVWSTFVLSHSNLRGDYKFHETIGTASAYLRDGFRKRCYEKVGGRDFLRLAPLAAAMYRVTHGEIAEVLAKHRRANATDTARFLRPTSPRLDELPLISFPWIFPDILGRIAAEHYELPTEPMQQHSNDAAARESTAIVHLKAVNENRDAVGLFTSEQTPLLHGPEADHITPKSRDRGKTDEPLHQLAEFGFSEIPQALLTGCGCSSMDLGSSPKQAKQKSNQPAEEAIDIDTDLVDTGGDKCVDIVEEDGDIQPNALDILEQMLREDV